MIDLTGLQLDDIVRTRKPHPCGSYEWRVVRLGADIGLRCLKCNRKVLLSRQRLARSACAFSRPDRQDATQSSEG